MQEAVFEVARLRWIQQNTPELQKDGVARRELSARLLEAEKAVSRELKAIFDEDNENTCSWYYKGKQHTISSYNARNVYLTDICKQIYSKTPIIRNELINRRGISGAATTARRKLIQHMLEYGNQKDLGIEGYPPELSIYRSLLLKTGIHRCESGLWGFHPPFEDDENKIQETWKEIEKYLTECETT